MRSRWRRYAIRSATLSSSRPCLAANSSSSGRRAISPSSRMISQITPAGLSPASRARSTEPSVWPVRTSTPPLRARSGKTWPGETTSRGPGVVGDRGADRGRAIARRDAGRHAVARLDRDRERGAERGLVVAHHHRQLEPVDQRVVHREADQAARVGRHEVDGLGRDELGGEHEVALVLAILVVDEDHHPARADLLQGARDAFDRAHADLPVASSFSTCLARMSTSRLTRSPIASSPSVVWSRVCGMIATENVSASTALTVRLHAGDRDRALLDDVAQQRRAACGTRARGSRRGRAARRARRCRRCGR